MKLHYFEIVTLDVDALCETYESINGVLFSEPQPELGHARVGSVAGGSRMGIRAPMNAGEEPVTRPYYLVDDIEAAVKMAKGKGAEIIHPPLEIPGHGTFAICLMGTLQYGFWQL